MSNLREDLAAVLSVDSAAGGPAPPRRPEAQVHAEREGRPPSAHGVPPVHSRTSVASRQGKRSRAPAQRQASARGGETDAFGQVANAKVRALLQGDGTDRRRARVATEISMDLAASHSAADAARPDRARTQPLHSSSMSRLFGARSFAQSSSRGPPRTTFPSSLVHAKNAEAVLAGSPPQLGPTTVSADVDTYQLPPPSPRPRLGVALEDAGIVPPDRGVAELNSVVAREIDFSDGLRGPTRGAQHLTVGTLTGRRPAAKAQGGHIRDVIRGAAEISTMRYGLDHTVPPGITTGAEAVTYFMRGKAKEGLLLYANFAEDPKVTLSWEPYSLVVVPREEARADNYFTISLTGVTHVVDGDEASSQELPEWLQDRAVFSMIKRMKFFTSFRLLKAFKRWRHNVRSSALENARRRLSTQWLQGHPQLGPHIRAAAAAIAEMHANQAEKRWERDSRTGKWTQRPWNPWVVPPQELRSWKPGVKELGILGALTAIDKTALPAQIEATLKFREGAIRGATDAMSHLVQTVVNETAAMGRAIATEVEEVRAQCAAEERKPKADAWGAQLTWRDKSLSAIKDGGEHRSRLLAEAQTREEKLWRAVRLVDQLMLQNMLQLATTAVTTFTSQLLRVQGLVLVRAQVVEEEEEKPEVQSKSLTGRFRQPGQISLEEQRKFAAQRRQLRQSMLGVDGKDNQAAPADARKVLELVPRVSTLELHFEHLVASVNALVTGFPRLVAIKQVVPYTEWHSSGGPPQNLPTVRRILVSQGEDPENYVRAVVKGARRDFRGAVLHPDTAFYFEQGPDRHRFAVGWSEHWYVDKTSLKAFQEDMESMKDWQTKLADATTVVRSGLIHLDVQDVRDKFLPAATRVVDGLADLVARFISKQCRELIAAASDATALLKDRPSEMEHFLSYMTDLAPYLEPTGSARARLEDLAKGLQEAERLFASDDLSAMLEEKARAKAAGEKQRVRGDALLKRLSGPGPAQTTGDVLAEWAEARAAFTEFEATSRDAQDFVDGFKAMAHQSLAQAAQDKEHAAMSLLTRARMGALASSATRPHAALMEIDRMEIDLLKLDDAITTLRKHEDRLGGAEVEGVAVTIKAVFRALEEKTKLWTALRSWDFFLDTMRTTETGGTDLPNEASIQERVEALDAALAPILEREVAPGDGLDSLTDLTLVTQDEHNMAKEKSVEVEWWKAACKQARILCSSSLRPRHRTRLLQILGQDLVMQLEDAIKEDVAESRPESPASAQSPVQSRPQSPAVLSAAQSMHGARAESPERPDSAAQSMHGARAESPERPDSAAESMHGARAEQLEPARSGFEITALRAVRKAEIPKAPSSLAGRGLPRSDSAASSTAPAPVQHRYRPPLTVTDFATSLLAVTRLLSWHLAGQQALQQLWITASREAELQGELMRLRGEWNRLRLEIAEPARPKDVRGGAPFGAATSGPLMATITNIPDLLQQVQNIQTQLDSASMSPHVGGIVQDLQRTEHALSQVADSLATTGRFQQAYRIVAMVFAASADAGADQYAEVQDCGAQWHNIMAMVREQPVVASACMDGGPLTRCKALLQRVLALNEGLERALEHAREHCPRLYFVDDNRLLDIISTGSSALELPRDVVRRVLPGAVELFDVTDRGSEGGTNAGDSSTPAGGSYAASKRFEPGRAVTAVRGAGHAEVLQLVKPVGCVVDSPASVAEQLTALVSEIRRTLHTTLLRAVVQLSRPNQEDDQDAGFRRSIVEDAVPLRRSLVSESTSTDSLDMDLTQAPLQIISLAQQCVFTDLVHRALVRQQAGQDAKALLAAQDVLLANLEQTVDAVRSAAEAAARARGSRLDDDPGVSQAASVDREALLLNAAQGVFVGGKLSERSKQDGVLGTEADDNVEAAEEEDRDHAGAVARACLGVLLRWRDLTDSLVANQADTPMALEWVRQVRYYMGEQDKETTVRVLDTSLPYGFEYAGAAVDPGPLMGINAFGGLVPVATGLGHGHVLALQETPGSVSATEAVKALAGAFGRYCVAIGAVQLGTAESLGRVAVGAIESGAWLCLANVERLAPCVLSHVAQKLQGLVTAFRSPAAVSQTTETLRPGLLDNGMEFEPQIFIGVGSSEGEAAAERVMLHVGWNARRMCLTTGNSGVLLHAVMLSLVVTDAEDAARTLCATVALLSEHLPTRPHVPRGDAMMLLLARTCVALGQAKYPAGSAGMELASEALELSWGSFLAGTSDEDLYRTLVADVFTDGIEEDRPDHLSRAGSLVSQASLAGGTLQAAQARDRAAAGDKTAGGKAKEPEATFEAGVAAALARLEREGMTVAPHEAEVVAALERMRAALDSSSGAMMVVGPPSSGKSALLRALGYALTVEQGGTAVTVDQVFLDASSHGELLGMRGGSVEGSGGGGAASKHGVLSSALMQDAGRVEKGDAIISRIVVCDVSAGLTAALRSPFAVEVEAPGDRDAGGGGGASLDAVLPLLEIGTLLLSNGSVIVPHPVARIAVETDSISIMTPGVLSRLPVVCLNGPATLGATRLSLIQSLHAAGVLTESSLLLAEAVVEGTFSNLPPGALPGPEHLALERACGIAEVLFSDLSARVPISLRGNHPHSNLTPMDYLGRCCLAYGLLWATAGAMEPDVGKSVARLVDETADSYNFVAFARKVPPLEQVIDADTVDFVHWPDPTETLKSPWAPADPHTKVAVSSVGARLRSELPTEPGSHIFIHTAGTRCVQAAAWLHMRAGWAPVLIGPAYSGKSEIARGITRGAGNHQLIVHPLVSSTGAVGLSGTLAAFLHQDRSSTLRPHGSGSALLLLDDLHEPAAMCVRGASAAARGAAARLITAVRMLCELGEMDHVGASGPKRLRLQRTMIALTGTREGLWPKGSGSHLRGDARLTTRLATVSAEQSPLATPGLAPAQVMATKMFGEVVRAVMEPAYAILLDKERTDGVCTAVQRALVELASPNQQVAKAQRSAALVPRAIALLHTVAVSVSGSLATRLGQALHGQVTRQDLSRALSSMSMAAVSGRHLPLGDRSSEALATAPSLQALQAAASRFSQRMPSMRISRINTLRRRADEPSSPTLVRTATMAGSGAESDDQEGPLTAMKARMMSRSSSRWTNDQLGLEREVARAMERSSAATTTLSSMKLSHIVCRALSVLWNLDFPDPELQNGLRMHAMQAVVRNLVPTDYKVGPRSDNPQLLSDQTLSGLLGGSRLEGGICRAVTKADLDIVHERIDDAVGSEALRDVNTGLWWGLHCAERMTWPGALQLAYRIYASFELPWPHAATIVEGPPGSGRMAATRTAALLHRGSVVVVEKERDSVREACKRAATLALEGESLCAVVVRCECLGPTPHHWVQGLGPILELLEAETLPPYLVPGLDDKAFESPEPSPRKGRATADGGEAGDNTYEMQELRMELMEEMAEAVRANLRFVIVVPAKSAPGLIAHCAPLAGAALLGACIPGRDKLSSSINAIIARHLRPPPLSPLMAAADEAGHRQEMQSIEVQFQQLASSTDLTKVSRAMAILHDIAVASYREWEPALAYATPILATRVADAARVFCAYVRQAESTLKEQYVAQMLMSMHLAAIKLNLSGAMSQLEQLQPIQEKTVDVISSLSVAIAQASRHRDRLARQMKTLKDRVSTAGKVAKQMREDLQKHLKEVQVNFEVAREDLSAIPDADVNELRSYHAPPAMVRSVLEAVMSILGMDNDWETAKRIMCDRELPLHERMKRYNPRNLSPEIVRTLQAYVVQDNFKPDVVAQVSRAAKSFCQWVISVHNLGIAEMRFAMAEQRVLQREYAVQCTYSVINAKQGASDTLQLQVRGLQIQRDEHVLMQARQERARAQLVQNIRRMRLLAEALEQHAHSSPVDGVSHLAVDSKIALLRGDAALVGAAAAYLGPLPGHLRDDLLERWRAALEQCNVTHSSHFSLPGSAELLTTVAEPMVPPSLQLTAGDRTNLMLVAVVPGVPLLVCPSGGPPAWLISLREKLHWQHVRCGSESAAAHVIRGLQQGGNILLRLTGTHEDAETILTVLDTVRSEERLWRRVMPDLSRPGHRALIAWSPGAPVGLPDSIHDALHVIDCRPSLSDLEERLALEAMRIRSPSREAHLLEAYAENEVLRRQTVSMRINLISELIAAEEKAWQVEGVLEGLVEASHDSLELHQALKESQAIMSNLPATFEADRLACRSVACAVTDLQQLALAVPGAELALNDIVTIFRKVAEAPLTSLDENEEEDRQGKKSESTRKLRSEPIIQAYVAEVARNLADADAYVAAFVLWAGHQTAQAQGQAHAQWVHWLRWFVDHVMSGEPAESGPATQQSRVSEHAVLSARSGAALPETLQVQQLASLLERDPDRVALLGLTEHVWQNEDEWCDAVSSESPADRVPEPWGSKMTRIQKVMVLTVLKPPLVWQLAKWFIDGLTKASALKAGQEPPAAVPRPPAVTHVMLSAAAGSAGAVTRSMVPIVVLEAAEGVPVGAILQVARNTAYALSGSAVAMGASIEGVNKDANRDFGGARAVGIMLARGGEKARAVAVFSCGALRSQQHVAQLAEAQRSGRWVLLMHPEDDIAGTLALIRFSRSSKASKAFRLFVCCRPGRARLLGAALARPVQRPIAVQLPRHPTKLAHFLMDSWLSRQDRAPPQRGEGSLSAMLRLLISSTLAHLATLAYAGAHGSPDVPPWDLAHRTAVTLLDMSRAMTAVAHLTTTHSFLLSVANELPAYLAFAGYGGIGPGPEIHAAARRAFARVLPAPGPQGEPYSLVLGHTTSLVWPRDPARAAVNPIMEKIWRKDGLPELLEGVMGGQGGKAAATIASAVFHGTQALLRVRKPGDDRPVTGPLLTTWSRLLGAGHHLPHEVLKKLTRGDLERMASSLMVMALRKPDPGYSLLDPPAVSPLMAAAAFPKLQHFYTILNNMAEELSLIASQVEDRHLQVLLGWRVNITHVVVLEATALAQTAAGAASDVNAVLAILPGAGRRASRTWRSPFAQALIGGFAEWDLAGHPAGGGTARWIAEVHRRGTGILDLVRHAELSARAHPHGPEGSSEDLQMDDGGTRGLIGSVRTVDLSILSKPSALTMVLSALVNPDTPIEHAATNRDGGQPSWALKAHLTPMPVQSGTLIEGEQEVKIGSILLGGISLVGASLDPLLMKHDVPAVAPSSGECPLPFVELVLETHRCSLDLGCELSAWSGKAIRERGADAEKLTGIMVPVFEPGSWRSDRPLLHLHVLAQPSMAAAAGAVRAVTRPTVRPTVPPEPTSKAMRA
ncbi:unnamed protein product [Pedinophyceae sp. YPF-701]|nr:unnamed protein product [Pedinophyceae sp. YPF-701]